MMHMTWDERTGAIPASTHDDAQLAAIMERWNAQVKASVPAEQLLVWDPADGWEPLCEFLEVAVPGGPVPRVNDTRGLHRGHPRRRAGEAQRVVGSARAPGERPARRRRAVALGER